MPAGDGTGPMGFGPRTGRKTGESGGDESPGWVRGTRGQFRGRGTGRRCRLGRGPGRRLAAAEQLSEMSEKLSLAVAGTPDELHVLREQAGSLEKSLRELQQRIAELESARPIST